MHSLNSGKTWYCWNTSNYTILSHFYQLLFLFFFSLPFTFSSAVFICCKHHLQVITCRENDSWKLMIDWWDVNDCILRASKLQNSYFGNQFNLNSCMLGNSKAFWKVLFKFPLWNYIYSAFFFIKSIKCKDVKKCSILGRASMKFWVAPQTL